MLDEESIQLSERRESSRSFPTADTTTGVEGLLDLSVLRHDSQILKTVILDWDGPMSIILEGGQHGRKYSTLPSQQYMDLPCIYNLSETKHFTY